ncbi:MAG: T9SS type A sorting domain-containing protein [Paludibacteraceae bacterium]
MTTPVVKINSISKNRASKIRIENQPQQEQYTPAFIKTARLLAEVIPEDFPLTVQIMYATASDLPLYTTDDDILAVTTTNFVLNNYGYRNPGTSNPDRDRSGMNKLIHQALANREYLADTDPSTPDMIIKLNPDIDFYTDTLNTNISEYQFDLTTVILREMVVGCGFVSSIRRDGSNLSYTNAVATGYEYPYLFDTYLVNNQGVHFSNVLNNTSSILSFLYLNDVYFNAYGENIASMLNDLSYSDNITDFTTASLNKIFDLDNQELMKFSLYSGDIIRTITPLTKRILQEMGWRNDINTSLHYQSCDIVSTDGSSITNLFPNVNYTFRPNTPPYLDWGSIQFFGLQLVKLDGEYYTLAQDNFSAGILPVNYASLPDYQWQRDPETGFIIGYIFFKSYNPYYSSWVGTSDYYFTGYKKVLLPNAPSSPIIGVTKTNTTSMTTDALVSYSSQGATSYKINYTTSGGPTQYVIEKANKEDLTCLLNSLPTNRKTTIYVTAQNSSGSSNSSTVTVGALPYSDMTMVITRVSSTLKYRFKSGTQYVTDLTINSAGIYDTNGNFKMNVSAGINETFSIASLTSGIYILKVDVADSTVFSKLFYK